VVQDVDAYHAQLLRMGVTVMSPLSDQPWGIREFSVKTLDGHRIQIGQSIKR
jgi:uncharacterized glyoxalase superfamily protein PhnB